jgi:FkbH-like protein
MRILDLQKFLFENEPSRLDLINYNSSFVYPEYTVFVCRNHSFELIEHTIKPYLDYAQMAVCFKYSDYDDSFTFSNLDTSSDLIIIWVDISHYKTENIYSFITQRILFLRTIYKKNILIAILNGGVHNFSIDNIYSLELNIIKEKLGAKFLDERLESFSGTKLSGSALLEISKLLALQYLPTLLKPAIKSIVVDLDNTLYQGILGEDGINGIILTEAHLKLQRYLFDLSKNGVLICIASKNDSAETKKLFDARTDFPLKWETFAHICASWEPKSQMIRKIKNYLNINEDSMVFMDDNVGEIIEVISVFPEIKIILANTNAEITYNIIKNFPGLFRFNNQYEDHLRQNDIKANLMRQELQQTMSVEEYLKSINMVLTYKINNHNDIPRIAELSNKTNQFIFTYKRYTVTEISEYMEDPTVVVISINLKDRLSESGLIGACVIKRKEKVSILEELFISCRALGRGIEEIMILNALKLALDRLGTDLLMVNFLKGAKNTSAELFVNNYLSQYLHNAYIFDYKLNNNLVEVYLEG